MMTSGANEIHKWPVLGEVVILERVLLAAALREMGLLFGVTGKSKVC